MEVKPTIFISNEEITEAIKKGYINRKHFLGIRKDVPVILWVDKNGLHYLKIKKLLKDKKDILNNLRILKKAKLWEDVKNKICVNQNY